MYRQKMRWSRPRRLATLVTAAAAVAAATFVAGCSSDDEVAAAGTERPTTCRIANDTPPFAEQLGCAADFEKVSSRPADASIPGARSVKTVVDRFDKDRLYFQNSQTYAVHWEFARAHLSGNGLPLVPLQSQFSQTEYYSPDRRFLLGAVTWYQEPGIWAYELSPYDTASAAMIETAYERIAAATFFGGELHFHPTSAGLEKVAAGLPATVKVITTAALFAGISYQPLNTGVSVGRLKFTTAKLAEAGPLFFRDLVVLDSVPNDIGVVAGIITAQFQTPLSHINVLSQNRGTPNMALTTALTNASLKALDGKWVELTVGPFDWKIREVTQQEADMWWDEHKPAAISVPAMNVTVTALTDIEDVLDMKLGLGPALAKAIPAFGGKASHYGAFSHMNRDASGALVLHEDGRPVVPFPKAFAVPLFYYRQFMQDRGFDAKVDKMLADPLMDSDPVYRDQQLKTLRDTMKAATIDAKLLAKVIAKLKADFPGVRMRFRSSTNAEDLDGFTGAGLYTSKSGDLNDPERPVDLAIKKVWASIWTSRAFQERAWRSIDHRAVGMALLVHRSFPDEEANGVALTANPFDTSGTESAFFINVQVGEASVVLPDAGVTVDSFLYYYDHPGQKQTFLSHSSLIPAGQTVLDTAQTWRLGQALARVRAFFKPLYGSRSFYAMDVEFKLDGEPGQPPLLFVKQARPYGGGT